MGDVDAFLTRYWARSPFLLEAADRAGWADLLSASELDRIVTSMGLRTPFFRLVKDGKELPASAYTRSIKHRSRAVSGLIDTSAVLDLYADGATIILESLHRYWEPMTQFCRQLEMDLGHPIQVNAYLTPAGAQGFARHSDSHDVFVLQTSGSKQWIVYRPDDPNWDSDAPHKTTELAQGDSFYIPEGWPHAANTNQVASAHLTVGILTRTRAVLREEIVALARSGEVAPERLPVRPAEDEAGLMMMVGEEIVDLKLRLDKLDHDELFHRVLRRLVTTNQEVMAGGFSQMTALGELDDSSRIRVREGSVFRLTPAESDVLLLLADRELRLPGFTAPALRAIKEANEFAIGDLAAHLDEGSRLVLTRRLIKEGLLEVVR